MPNYALDDWKWGSPTLGTSGGMIEWSFTSFAFPGQHYAFLTPHVDFQAEIRRAFDRWEAATDIDFQEVTDSFSNDIRIGFAPLDGAAGATLGEAWIITSGGTPNTPTRMEVAFDTDESWVWENGRIVEEQSGVSFYVVALHEIGHAIGLDHYEGEPAVMNSFMTAAMTDLLPSDIAGVQALYGTKLAPPPPPTTPTPPPPTTPTPPSPTADVFRISSASANVPINDFDPAMDQIFLEDSVFWRLGSGSADGTPLTNPKAFVANTSGLATIKKGAQIIYETDTGELYYDRDGWKGYADPKLFATVTNKTALSLSDFELF